MKTIKIASDLDIGTIISLNGVSGTVIGNQLSDGDSVVAVEWNDGSLTKANVADLILRNSELEADYAEIQIKLSQAAQALSDANRIALKHKKVIRDMGYDFDSEEELDFDELFSQLREAGWTTSSMNC